MKNKLGTIVLLLVVSCLLLVTAGCGGGKKALQIKGSDTMVNLAQSWAEEFMKENPKIPVAITGGGSGTGIAALLSGSTDIAQSSREMEKKELDMAKKRNINPKEIIVADDGIVVVVSPLNPVQKLTENQLSDIYIGKIKNWKEIGGKDEKIVVLSRDRNSGTHVFFLEHVIKLGDKKNANEFASNVLMMPSSQAIVEEVANNPSAIGYIGLGYLTGKLKALGISKAQGSPYVVPSIATVSNKTYPISRSLQMYTNGEPTENIKVFIDFVLSPKGQEIVKKMDFVPIK